MIAQRIWALIAENKVQNMIVCETYPAADMLAKSTLGTDAFAVEITQIPTGIGDSHENGVFKDKQGNVINSLPTAEQEVVMLKAKNTTLETELLNTKLATAELVEQQQTDKLNNQLALAEVIESIMGGGAEA
jgi:hypothetical protein